MNRVETMVDYFTSENFLGDRENIIDQVERHLDQGSSTLCQLD